MRNRSCNGSEHSFVEWRRRRSNPWRRGTSSSVWRRSCETPMKHTPRWQKSTFSDGGEGDTCVEIATAAGDIRLRESTTPATHLRT
ncbi:DUF397 domain-containing protein, partial [Streptomyces sp. MB09-02B]|uniref:DUF397 domain-containing protein n=1 Tax=Streptomyces sp. MB09-02B TaxID=3028667 RepID=UPI0029C0084C